MNNTGTVAPKKGTSNRVGGKWSKLPLYLMLLPGLLVILANNYLPMGGILLAFKDYNYAKGFWQSDWVGFSNFQYLFSSDQAFIITRNTLLYNTMFILISVTVALGLAIVLSELRNRRLAKIYQSIFFLPYFLSWVVVSYLVFSLLSSDMGVLNQILAKLGMDPINWYTAPQFWPGILLTVNTWKWTGYDSVIYLAAIVSIDKSYYEAAAIDGATRWQQIRYITIPSITPVITIVTLLLAYGAVTIMQWVPGLGFLLSASLTACAILVPVERAIDRQVKRISLGGSQ